MTKTSSASKIIITRMTADDLCDVMRIQQRAYKGELVESFDTLASRLNIAPQFAFIAREQAHTRGYLLAHPWLADASPGLGLVLETLPEHGEVLHLHDMAIDPAYSSRGIGRALLGALTDATRRAGFNQITLVAVQGADSYWQKMGFCAVRRVDGYGARAILMRLDLPD